MKTNLLIILAGIWIATCVHAKPDRANEEAFGVKKGFAGHDAYSINGKNLKEYSPVFQKAFLHLRATHAVSATLHSRPEIQVEALYKEARQASKYGIWLERGYLAQLPESGARGLPQKLTIYVMEPASLEELRRQWKAK